MENDFDFLKYFNKILGDYDQNIFVSNEENNKDNDDVLKLEVALPGCPKKDIKISYSKLNNILTIKGGEKYLKRYEMSKSYDFKNPKSSYIDGLLTLEFNKNTDNIIDINL